MDKTAEELAAEAAAAEAARVAAQQAEGDGEGDAAAKKAAQDAADAAKAEADAAARTAAGVAEDTGAPATGAVGDGSDTANARIRRLIAEREEARRREEYWRGRAEEAAKQPESSPASPSPTGHPVAKPTFEVFVVSPEEYASVGLTAENFEKAGRTYDDLVVAKAAYVAQKRDAAAKKVADEDRGKEARRKVHDAFMERIDKAAEADPGLREILDNYHIPTSSYHIQIGPVLVDLIKESEVAPKVLRFFSANKAEAARLSGLSPLAAAREFGKLEAKILATPAPPPPKRVSEAPAPIKPLAPKGSMEIDLDKVPIDDFMRERNARQFGGAKG